MLLCPWYIWRILDSYFVEFYPSFGVIRCFFMIGLSRYHFDIPQKCKCLLITSYQEVNRVVMFFSLSLRALFATDIANIFFFFSLSTIFYFVYRISLSWKVLSFNMIKFIQFVLPLDYEWKLFSILMLKRNLPCFFLLPVWQMAIRLV